MAEVYTIDTLDGIQTVHFTKPPTMDQVRSAIDDVAGNNPMKLRLWDFTACGLDLPADQIVQLAKYGKSKRFPPSRLAIVAPEDITYGLSRVFESHRDDEAVEQMIFRTVKEARAWLSGFQA